MNEKKYDVVALGELLIDLTENGLSAQGNPLMEANPGGAPCNVLSMLSNLSHPTAFIGKVGNDGFGKMLAKTIKEQGIDDSGLKYDEEIPTTLALVLRLANGDRDFAFYRNPGADCNLAKDEVNTSLIELAKIFHFGSLSFTNEKVVEASKYALEVAKKNNCIISFDPNLREPLWKTLDDAHRQIAYGLQQCDVLKISDNEIQWFTGKEDFDEGVEVLKEQYPNIRLICLSMGSDGSRAYYGDVSVEVSAFKHDEVVDTTGAGDTFMACVLHDVLVNGLENRTLDSLYNMLVFANAAASLVTKRKGALKVMPKIEDIQEMIGEQE